MRNWTDLKRGRRSIAKPAPCSFEGLENRVLMYAQLGFSGGQTITPDTVINVSNDGTSLQSEMSIDANPTDPLNVVGVTHQIASSVNIDLYFSNNGGDTWTRNVINNTDDGLGTGTRFDPALKFDPDGHLYVAYGFNNGTTTRLVVARSDDGGAGFANFTVVENRANIGALVGVDKWQLATGLPTPGMPGTPAPVYVAYTQNADESGSTDQRIVVSGSINNGGTFTTPIVINDSSLSGSSSGNLFAHPSVGKNNELYVSWHDINGNAIRFDRDLDGLFASGSAFGTDILVRNLANGSLFKYLVPAQPERGIFTGPVMDVDRGDYYRNFRIASGTIYITFVERASSNANETNTIIRLATSTDNGSTWTIRTVESVTGTHFLPWVSVDRSSGAAAVIYYTTNGNTGGDLANVRPRLAVTSDSGVTFGRANLTNTTSDETGGYGGDYLEYIGLAFIDGTAQALWAARRPSTTDLDAYSTRAHISSTSGRNKISLANADTGPIGSGSVTIQRNATNADFAEVLINGMLQYRGLYASIGEIDIDGLAGANNILIGSNLYVPTTVTGSSGNDSITGGGGNDWIDGGAGNDWLSGRNGNDIVIGSTGADTLYAGNGNDQLYGNDGNDLIWADGDSGYVDTISGGAGSDVLHYDSGVDILA